MNSAPPNAWGAGNAPDTDVSALELIGAPEDTTAAPDVVRRAVALETALEALRGAPDTGITLNVHDVIAVAQWLLNDEQHEQ